MGIRLMSRRGKKTRKKKKFSSRRSVYSVRTHTRTGAHVRQDCCAVCARTRVRCAYTCVRVYTAYARTCACKTESEWWGKSERDRETSERERERVSERVRDNEKLYNTRSLCTHKQTRAHTHTFRTQDVVLSSTGYNAARRRRTVAATDPFVQTFSTSPSAWPRIY